MDRADKFINNSAPKKTLLIFAVMVIMSAAISLFLASMIGQISAREQIKSYLSAIGGGNITEEPSDEQITAGEADMRALGVSMDMPPKMVNGYKKVRNIAFFSLFGLSLSCSAIWMILRLRGLFAMYDDLESIGTDCRNAANSYGGRIGLRGEDMGCMRRMAENADLLAERTEYLSSRYEREKRYLSEFLGDFSHQIKTSLAVVRLNTDILTETENIPRQQRDELSDELQLNLDGMETLVVQAIKLARLEAETVEYSMEEKPLADTCERALRKLAPILRNHGISVKKSLSEDIVLLHDSSWLCEAIENIMKNSADHSGCTEIGVVIESEPALVRLILTDNGRGIPQRDIPRLFERFAKRSSDRSMKSAGLGMSIARKIVIGHGGDISVYSEEGRGTRFEIVFII